MSTYQYRCALVFLLSFNLTATRLKAGNDWWNDEWEGRWLIVVTNTGAAERLREVVVVTGGQLLDCSPGLTVDTRSLRIVSGSALIPSQVDEKDATGCYVGAANHVLDADDEICFQVSLKPGEEQKYHIYFSREQKPENPWKSDLGYEAVPETTKERPYNLLLKNGVIEVGIAGFENPKDANEQWKTRGAGAITHLNKAGINMFHNNTWMPHMKWNAWPSRPERPEILVKGPVRLIAVVRYGPVDLKWSRDPATWCADGNLKNAVRTYYYQIAADSRTIEFTVDICYEKANIGRFRELWEFTPAIGDGKLRPEQTAYSSFKGEARQQKIADFVETHFVNGTLTNLITLGGHDGWVAFHDPVSKSGLGVFGEPDKNSAWVTFPVGSKLGENFSPEFHFAFFTANIPSKRLVRRYWFVALDDEDLESAMNWRTAYLNPPTVYVTRWECNKKR